MFKRWFIKADTYIPNLEAWQVAHYEKQLKKAYKAGFKAGKEKGFASAMNDYGHMRGF